MSAAYEKTLGRIEQGIAPIDGDTAAASIAISLKRIADAMEQRNVLLQKIVFKDALDTLKPGGPAIADGADIARHGGESSR